MSANCFYYFTAYTDDAWGAHLIPASLCRVSIGQTGLNIAADTVYKRIDNLEVLTIENARDLENAITRMKARKSYER